MIILDYKDTRPIYEQVVDKLQKLIINGVLEPDSKMPSVSNGAFHQSGDDTKSICGTGAERFFVYDQRQRKFCHI